jgi:hypothetical protein
MADYSKVSGQAKCGFWPTKIGVERGAINVTPVKSTVTKTSRAYGAGQYSHRIIPPASNNNNNNNNNNSAVLHSIVKCNGLRVNCVVCVPGANSCSDPIQG